MSGGYINAYLLRAKRILMVADVSSALKLHLFVSTERCDWTRLAIGDWRRQRLPLRYFSLL